MSASGSANSGGRPSDPRYDSPRAAYIHVPFCRHHCGYCNFSVIANRLDLTEDYLRAIDLESSALAGPHPVDTIYVGGGTPTQLPDDALTRLLSLLHERFPLAPQGELTVEANPEDLQPEVVARLREAGVTRVSLGAQSFHEEKLRSLDRQHTVAQIDAAIEALHDAELDVALDLIFAAPQETLIGWQADLAAALQRQPGHFSCYGLTIEPGTRFGAQRLHEALCEVDEETQRAQYEHAIDDLTAHGFEHYEVSNFARPGRRSRHNQAYWLGRTFFGLGPGAARFVQGERAVNHRSTTTYLKRTLRREDPTTERDHVSEEEYARDRLVFGLRMLDGVSREAFRSQTGFSMEALAGPVIANHVDRGFLAWTGDRLHLTRQGLLVSDAIWPDLL